MLEDETYDVPLQDQRVFGAGIKRQRIKFVPSSSSSSINPAHGSTLAQSVSDLYLGLVLPKEVLFGEVNTQSTVSSPLPSTNADESLLSTDLFDCKYCEVCKLPLSSIDETIPMKSEDTSLSKNQQVHSLPTKRTPHEASLVHQVCLSHSHPPSHLDRKRKGLAYLSAYGRDPDARKGLGAEGQGIQFPIKTKPKDDKLGIGVALPKLGDIKRQIKPQKLDAGKIRKLHERDKRKDEKLREMFYRSEDVERYLAGS